MSGNSDYKLYVQIDNTEFSRQVERIEKLFDKINSRAGVGSHAIGGVSNVISGANNGMAQVQLANKQMTMFGKISDGIGGIMKNTLGIIGIATSVAAISALIVESSPILKSVFRLMNVGVMMLLRPIGDFIGMLLRPIMVMMLQKFIIPYYQYVDPFMRKLGASVGGKIADFFNDPVKSLYGLFVNILNWPKPPGEDNASGTSGSSGSGGSSGSSSAVAQSTQKMVQDTTNVSNATGSMSDLMDRASQDTNQINSSVERMKAQFAASQKASEDASKFNDLTKQKYNELYHTTQLTTDQANASSQAVVQSLQGINQNMASSKSSSDVISNLVTGMQVLFMAGSNAIKPMPDTASSITGALKQAGTNIDPVTGKTLAIKNAFATADTNSQNIPDITGGITDKFNQALIKVSQWLNGFVLPGINAPLATPVFASSGGGGGSSSSGGFVDYAHSGIGAIANALSNNPTGAALTGATFNTGGGLGSGTGVGIPAQRMANGGIISEHIFGIGQSGKRYEFGESGREAVVPLGGGKGAGSGGNIINFYVTVNKDADFSKLKPLVLQWIKDNQSRTGRP